MLGARRRRRADGSVGSVGGRAARCATGPAPGRLVFLLLISSVTMIAADRHDPSIFRPARASTLSAAEPARSGLQQLTAPAIGAWEGAKHHDRWDEDNRRLRARVDELEGRRGQEHDAQLELERVLAATEIDYVSDLETVTARVVVDRRSNGAQILEIDKGTRHGIAVGMPVVTGRGLVGTIVVVSAERSVAEPLTAVGQTIGVRSASGYGVVTGAGPGRPLQLALAPGRSGEAEAEERFVTSGVDRSLYPGNIPVGTGRSGPDGEGDGALQPFVELDELGYVTVLRWQTP